MLLAISYQLRTALTAAGVPYPVVYGPEQLGQTVMAKPHIVLERDRQSGDALRPPTTHRRNPRLDHVRAIGATLRVFARSTTAAPGPGDHEREADRIVDQCLVALRGIVSARRTMWELRSAKLLTVEEAEAIGLETWPGVIYEVRFAVDRGVTALGWAEAAAAAGAAGTNAADESLGFGGAHGPGTETTVDTDDSPGGPGGILPGSTTR